MNHKKVDNRKQVSSEVLAKNGRFAVESKRKGLQEQLQAESQRPAVIGVVHLVLHGPKSAASDGCNANTLLCGGGSHPRALKLPSARTINQHHAAFATTSPVTNTSRMLAAARGILEIATISIITCPFP
eukprot:COSAG02_NODE_4772_length_4994_cov_16.312768_8_plen_129_part_00